ncbi:MAG: hypothetical protein CVV41_06885 [Candidatus Riflebacteria bacterium HGW-Riflebacteria-1]|jgi:hypothetical protein|nr:MAG: hypothetical protein CVV41_06885 [Candidatus Riflebacteria bacterium HGW-Riflebacteria-1]
MSDNESKNPITQALGPAASNFGKEIAPLGTDAGKLVYGIYETVLKKPYDCVIAIKSEAWKYFKSKLDERLSKETPENLIPPKLAIAEPIIEHAVRLENEKELQDMFANLLSSSMIKNSSNKVLPSFVEALKQLSSDEAKIIKSVFNSSSRSFACLTIKAFNKERFTTVQECFSLICVEAGCEIPNRTHIYVQSLARLGILQQIQNTMFADMNKYKELEHAVALLDLVKDYEILAPGCNIVFEKNLVQLTDYGKLLCEVCVK